MRYPAAVALLSATGLVVSICSATSDEMFDNYMENAAPVMHYSCASLAEEAGDDTEQMLQVVRLMVAVSLHNRQIDLTTYDLSDARKQEIKAQFVEMLGEGCATDSNALLAGIVDTSVAKLVGSDQ